MIKVLFLLIVFSCEDNKKNDNTSIPFEIYMNAEYDTDCSCYVIDYPNEAESSYTSVHYLTEPITRVWWYSDDTYTFIYWGRPYTYPIIVNSTYSSEYGIGQQMIYLYQDHIGDTLSVYGCIDDNCKGVRFRIE